MNILLIVMVFVLALLCLFLWAKKKTYQRMYADSESLNCQIVNSELKYQRESKYWREEFYKLQEKSLLDE